MSHIPIAFLLLGGLAPFYAVAAIWDRGGRYTRVRLKELRPARDYYEERLESRSLTRNRPLSDRKPPDELRESGHCRAEEADDPGLDCLPGPPQGILAEHLLRQRGRG